MEPVAICAKLCDKTRTIPAEGDPDWMVYNPAQCEFCSGSKSVYFILIFNFVLETGSRSFLAGSRVGIIGPSNPGISSEKLRLELNGFEKYQLQSLPLMRLQRPLPPSGDAI